MTENNNKKNEILDKLCSIVNQAELNQNQLLKVLIDFMYTLGASIENIIEISSEEILKQYANNPTIGNALMAQALYMQDTWLVLQEEKDKKDE